jgi:hypothetical protein
MFFCKNSKTLLIVLLLSTLSICLTAQTGPNSPTVSTNDASIGTLPWTSSGNILTSDNAYSTVSTNGTSNYLFGTSFGFAITTPSTINGIILEVEKKELSPASVTILNAWGTGTTRVISAGVNRCLVVVVGMENGAGLRDITAMTYGGQAMTQALESSAAGAFSDKLEVWILLEAGIAAAAGTTIVPTFAAGPLLENVERVTSVVFNNVDQTTPISASATSSFNGATNPHILGATFATLAGSMAVAGVICGNNKTPAVADGGTNTYGINSAFVEGIDIYSSNPVAAPTGMCMQTATKSIAVAGTEQPTFTFVGTVNRHAALGFTIQRARALDNEVRLLKGGAPVGTNLGLTNTSWPTADSYISYGGIANLWGTTWTEAEVNAAGFGAGLSAKRSNGDLHVDHYRITIYSTSTLPIELLEFGAETQGTKVKTHWVTATETNNSHFIVERSINGDDFQEIGRLAGAGNSVVPLAYEFDDMNPVTGTLYYRLKQVDFNGDFSYSQIVPVVFDLNNSVVQVYPNPSTTGIFNFLQTDNCPINEVAVFTSEGKLIRTVIVPEGQNPIVSIEGEADGSYYLIYNACGERKVSKVQKTSAQR